MKKIISIEDFKEKSNLIHSNKYDYSKSVYGKNDREKIIIICSIHGEFLQAPSSHLLGRGCKRCSAIKANTTHNLNSHPLYSRWDGMMQRCSNINHSAYKYYGGRGIIVSDYLKNVQNYINYLESLENYENYKELKLEVDRIDNNKGYEVGNLRWISRSEQMKNQGLRITNTSGEKGISYMPSRKKYRVYRRINGKHVHLGLFDTLEIAKQKNKEWNE